MQVVVAKDFDCSDLILVTKHVTFSGSLGLFSVH